MTETDVIRVSNQINSVIGLHQTTKDSFYKDIESIKSGKFHLTPKGKCLYFENKYPELFNSQVAKYKNTSSFIGSVRRNTNPNQYNQCSNPLYVQFNQDLRTKTKISVKKIQKGKKIKGKKIKNKKQKVKVQIVKPIKSKTISKKGFYKSMLVFPNINRKNLINVKNVWEIQKAKNLFTFQEVHLIFNFDVLYYDNKKKKWIVLSKDNWYTATSGNSSKLRLLELYDFALINWNNFVVSLRQSKLDVRIKKELMRVFRIGQ